MRAPRWSGILLGATLGLPLSAQSPTPARPGREWSLSIQVERRSFSMDLEDALHGAGFWHTRPGGCSGFGLWPICWDDTPPSTTEYSSGLSATFRVRVTPRVSIGLLGDMREDARVATGYSVERDEVVHLKTAVGLLAVVASFEPAPNLRLGGGPALVSVDTGFGPNIAHQGDTNLGALLEAGLVVPGESRFFFDVSAQYRWAPDVTVGPTDLSGPAMVLPATDVPVSHFVLSIGVGVRWHWE